MLGKSKSQKDTLQTSKRRIAEVKPVKIGSKTNPMVISANSSESAEPLPGSFTVRESASLRPETDNPFLGSEQLSSCGSASTNPLLADLALPKKAESEDHPHVAQQKENRSTRFPTDQTIFTNGITHNYLESKVLFILLQNML